MKTLTIAGRELRTLFLSPLAWTILAVVQLIFAWEFLGNLQNYQVNLQSQIIRADLPYGVTDLVVARTFSTMLMVMLFVVPLLSMRLISEERRSGTLSLLLSAPVRMSEIVLGKYLGLMGFLAIMLAMVLIGPVSLLTVTDLDTGKLAAAGLGLLLLLGAFAAAGLFMSSLTRQPVIAAMATFGLLLFLLLLNWAAGTAGEQAGEAIRYLSMLDHYQPLLKGNFASRDVAYYLLFMFTFLVLSIRRLDNQRLPH